MIDATTSDTLAKELFSRFGGTAAVIAPLFSGAEFLGAVVATYRTETASALSRDLDLHARLIGLADQAATGFQNAHLHEQISHMAWHDDLTGLPNRRLLEDRVDTELERSRRHGEGVCIFFVDLDRFKMINDGLGHAAGDELIRLVAARLSETVRRQDTVARLGADEFAVLLPGLSDTGSIEHLARRSLEALSAPYTIHGREVRSSASIGVAFTPDHGDSFDQLLNRADEAMYRSKTLGRNRFHVFDGPVEDGAGDGLHLDSEIPGALDRGEFFILFQPIIDLSTTQVTGVEALVRWRHPTRGVLEPSAFIPTAEESDVIVTLDTWVLRESCRQIRRWRESGLPPLRLCVNVASRDLAQPTVVDTVRSVLADEGIEPSMLEFEITERVVLDAAGIAERHVVELGELGVRFAIDDFGAGNSSMNRIGTLPVSTLKIDPSFVHVLGPESESSALVSAIITMAQRLGLECVAEGVETSQQSRVLVQRGCFSAQGFYFCPPLLANDIERLLLDGPHLGDPGEVTGAAS